MSNEKIRLDSIPDGTQIIIKGTILYSRLKNPIQSKEEIDKRANELRSLMKSRGKKAFPTLHPHRLLSMKDCTLVDPAVVRGEREKPEFTEDEKRYFLQATYSKEGEDGTRVFYFNKERLLPSEEQIRNAEANNKTLGGINYFDWNSKTGQYVEYKELPNELSKDQEVYVILHKYTNKMDQSGSSFDTVMAIEGQPFDYYTASSSNPLLVGTGFAKATPATSEEELEALEAFDETPKKSNKVTTTNATLDGDDNFDDIVPF